MFFTTLRKMLKNKWLVLCLLFGCLLAVSVFSSIPIYTNGILQRMLVKDLKLSFENGQNYPGMYSVSMEFKGNPQSQEQTITDRYQEISTHLEEKLIPMTGLPVQSRMQFWSVNNFLLSRAEEKPSKLRSKKAGIAAVGDWQEHIRLVSGEMPSAQLQDGCIQVLMTSEAMEQLKIAANAKYALTDTAGRFSEPLYFQVVGVFEPADDTDLFWAGGMENFKDCVVMDDTLFSQMFLETGEPKLNKVRWVYALDYTKMDTNHISKVNASAQEMRSYIAQMASREDYPANTASYVSMVNTGILETYQNRVGQMYQTLWILQTPIVLMLVFYIFMVSQLVVEFDKNEIAVLKSRGASRMQILRGYFYQSLVIAAVSVVLGPLLGLLVCKILGSANGFLEFVQRTPLPVSLNGATYLFAAGAAVLFILTMILPVFLATRTTIVKLKQSKAHKRTGAFWKKYFLDVILVGISLYGLYLYHNRRSVLLSTGADSSQVPVDPLLFVISTLFILGVGLLFLRLFPLVVRGIFKLGEKRWSPGLYASLIQVSRSQGQNQFLMVFLILTVGLGIFSANTARTLNQNNEDRISYSVGADMVTQESWGQIGVNYSSEDSGDTDPGGSITYVEPSFGPYTKMNTVELATKVLREKSASAYSGESVQSGIQLMGIIPYEFGQITWSRKGLLPYHINQYLNLMSEEPSAVLVSQSLMDKMGLSPGSPIYLKRASDDKYLECFVYAAVDYWPTYNPFDQQGDLIIFNYDYLARTMPLTPYQVWYRLKDGVSSSEFYDELEGMDKNIISASSMKQQLVALKNDPYIQGTNGTLTLGFLVTMVVSAVGFLIYWILNIKGRMLQFGILRSMGLSKKNLVWMLVWEQLLISLSAALAGLGIGLGASALFVPLLEVFRSASEQVPPFQVVFYGSDLMKVLAIVLVILGVGLAVLTSIVSRIKMSQALKLGEE